VALLTEPVGRPVKRIVSRFVSGLTPAAPKDDEGARNFIQRIVRRIPIVTKFMAFFVPDELRLDPPEEKPAEQADTGDLKPVYNAKARKPKGLTLG
jgi:hypothetical protein